MRPAPTIPTLDAPWLGVRDTDSALRPALDKIERVYRCLRLRPGEEVCERVLLRPVALLERPGRCAFDQVESPVRGRRGSVQLAVEPGPRLAARSRKRRTDRLQAVACPPPSSIFWTSMASDSSRNSTGSSSASAKPASNACCGPEHPVLAERVLDDELDRLLCSDELRDELRSSPARDRARGRPRGMRSGEPDEESVR